MSIYKQGDIILVRFPYTDLTGDKVRPALVVSKESDNKSSRDIIVVQITSKDISRLKYSFELTKNDVIPPFRPKYNKHFISCRKIATLEQSIIKAKIHEIKDKELVKKILEIIKSLFGYEP